MGQIEIGGSRKAGLLLALAALVALAIPAVADAKKKGKGAPKVTVMTRNVFLGRGPRSGDRG